MNNKLLLLWLCAFLCSRVSATPDHKDELASLKSASVFAIGGIGFAGQISEPEKALHAMLHQPNAKRGFETLLKTATMEGQLYALLGLRLTDRQAFLRERKHYLRWRHRIAFQAADIGMSLPASYIVKKIAHGDYDVRVAQD